MTPPIFNLDDEVIITGKPVTLDTDEFLGKRFTIDTIGKRHGEIVFSDACLPWYPASSLRLVEPEELKIGDWVRIDNPEFKSHGEIFQISGVLLERTGTYLSDAPNKRHFAECHLRKLTPEEVVMYTGTIGYKMQEEVAKAKDAVRKILVPLVNERLAPYQESIEETQRSMVALEDRVSAIEKEDWQKSIDVLMGERPEVHQIPNGEPIHIVIVKGDKMHTWCDTCQAECLAWCEKVLDSMREG